ncbi:MAG: L,D-transpeptidase family protein, partial [Burkholderiales bacterium]
MRLLAISLLLISCAAAAATPEDRLSAVFQAIEANRLDEALLHVDALIRDHPNFRLAHLVRGDLLLARARPLETFGNVAKTVPGEKIDGLREEALARLRAQRSRPAEDRMPRYVLQLHPEQKHALVVDSRRSRLYVFANAQGRPRLIADFYVTLGKNGIEKTREGDQKTPVGVYHVTANLPRKKLTDFYGAGAFPINYPNEWDRRQGRDGYGIWLHGVPSDVYSRPPRASDG